MSLSVFNVGVLLAVGLALGSFGSVITGRVPKGKSIGGRSQCPACKMHLAARDLIPVISYMLLRGQCRYCEKKIPIRYPLLELGSAAVITFPALVEGYSDPYTLSLGIALWLFLLLAVMDGASQTIPDAVSLPLLAVALLSAYLRGEIFWLAPAVGGGFFGGQWLISRGRILGSGDIFVGTAMGFLLGTWQMTILGIGTAYVIGAVGAGALLIAGKYNRKSRIAFVPFLFTGTLMTMLWGEKMMMLYMH